MMNQNTTTTDILTHATAAASVAIRGKHSQSGNDKLTRMQNSRKADTITEATADTMSEAGTLRAKAAELREEAKHSRAYANQSGRTPAEVRSGRAEAKRLDKAAAKLDKAAKAMEDSTAARTFSDFQPIKHDAVIGRITAEQTAYTVTPADMDKATVRLWEAVKAHEAPAGLDLISAARSAAAIVGLEADEESGKPTASRPEYLFEMAYSAAIFRAATNAANKAITANLHHDSHNRTTERKTLATPEIMEAWKAAHGNNSGKGYKVYQGRDNSNWYTMEYRQYKTEPTAWYLVHHHKTISPTVSIEAFTEDSHGAEAELVTNGGIPMVETQEARERIESIIEDMNPTAREADFLRYFLSTKAAHAGQAAVNEAEAVKVAARRAEEAAKAAKRTAATKRTKEATEAAESAHRAAKAARAEADKVPNDVDLIRYRAMRKAAAAHVGIQTDTAERKFMERLRARAAEAVKLEQGCTTPEEAAEAEAKHWEQMQKNRTRGRKAAEAVQVLFVGIDSPEAIEAAAKAIQKQANRKHATKADKARAERAAKATEPTKATKATPVITWNESGNEPQTMTPAEVEAMTARERAAHAAYINEHSADIARLQYRRQFTAARTTPTAFPALNAQTAARVFWDAMTPEEQTAHIEAERARAAAHAAELARIRAEAEAATKAHRDTWNSRPTEAITAAAWNAMNGQTRLAWLDRIHEAGKRLEIVTA